MQMIVEDQVHSNKQQMRASGQYVMKQKKVRDVVTAEKRRLVEVPYTATLAHTINALEANHVVAVPVAAPPGHWIGAGGSMIVESDKHTGTVRKHYIGMVTMLDILDHIAGDVADVTGGGAVDDKNLDQTMSVPVSSVIGHCIESLSLWTFNPNTSIMDCMEVFSKGIHRALVPIDSHMKNVGGVELVESASCYKMITQMDLLKFLAETRSADHELQGIMSRSVSELGAVSDHVFGVTDCTRVIDAIKLMRAASLTAVPVVQSFDTPGESHILLVDGKGRRLVGTFSATDLRGCPISQLRSWLPVSVMAFTEKLSLNPPHVAATPSDLETASRELVTCYAETLLSEVVDKAVAQHVHRVWVVDRRGLLTGLVSLSDIIRVFRASLLHELS